MQNWAGNYTYRATRVESPATADEVATIVAAEPRVRALGTRHCFNAIADCPDGVQISTHRLDRVLSVDTGRRQVTVEGGVTYGKLNPVLHEHGLMLPNLASLPHVSIAGACATATHGSGESLGCLATHVAAMTIVTADGTPRSLKRGDPDFAGAVVHLGRLGVIVSLTLDCVPAFEAEQFVYRDVPRAEYVDHLDAIAASVYSLSVFTTWQTDRFEQVWCKCVAGRPHFDVRSIGGRPAERKVHPIESLPGLPAFAGYDPVAATEQLGVRGPAYLRLTHFKLEHTPSSGDEIQSEYFVPRQHAAAAWAAVAALRDVLRPVIQISELRLVAADELWMSPFYQRPSAGIHFTWRKEPAAVRTAARALEVALAPFDARPHPGKVSTIADAAAAKYPRKADFDALVKRFDPHGKFTQTPHAAEAAS